MRGSVVKIRGESGSLSLSLCYSRARSVFRPFRRSTLSETFPRTVFFAGVSRDKDAADHGISKKKTGPRTGGREGRKDPARRVRVRGVSTVGGEACSLIVKLALITATNYPAVIRVLSERYPGRYPPLPYPVLHGGTLSPSSESLPSP